MHGGATRSFFEPTPLNASPRRAVHFTCPSCGTELHEVDSVKLVCENGHAFDIAREGHVHLLPPARKRVTLSDESVRQSRAFFEGGGFAEQIDGVAAEVVRALLHCPPVAGVGAQVLAVGCGEGIYLRAVEKALSAAGGTPPIAGLWGIDASNLSVRYAARRQPGACFAVASPHHLPFADGTLDLVFSVFAPAPWAELCRVLRPGGAVIVARGGFDHLRSLYALAGADALAAPRAPKQFTAGLAENYARIRSKESFRGEMAASLLAMTPFVQRAPTSVRERLYSLPELTTTVDVIMSTHRVWLGTGGGRFEL